MELTPQFRQWFVDNKGVDKDATDEEFQKATASALMDGSLAPEKFKELTTTKQDEQVGTFQKMMTGLQGSMDKLATILTEKEDSKEVVETDQKDADKKNTDAETKEVVAEKKMTQRQPTRLEKALIDIGSPNMVGGDDEKDSTSLRIKSAAEQYDSTKTTLIYPKTTKSGRPHPLADSPVMDQGRKLDSSSELDKALAGVWMKFQIYSVTPKFGGNSQAAWHRLNDHEKSLLAHLVEDGQWDNSNDHRPGQSKGYLGINGGRGIKTLIDDATSGGLEAAPIVFDDMVIEAPLLYGELAPLVNMVPLSRGRRVEGVATGRVTGSWGGVDATAINLFDTTSYVTAFDTTIFRWEGAVKLGLDFLSDTPIDFSSHLTRQYGERLLEDLDDVIATGNGTTQPEGVMSKSGTTTVTWSGATSISNYESLRFSVAKPELRGPTGRTAVFCGTETSYQRCRAIPVGGSDARRLFGQDHFGPGAGGYSFGGASFRINESLTNQQIFYAVLGRYRMYRRKGFSMRTSTEGDTLIRRNEMLIVAMARYGGQLERGACAGVVTDAPS